MTLIIGCITKDYGIIAGDTQLTVGDLNRGRNLKQDIKIKIQKCSNDFMFGILGKWSWFSANAQGKAISINEYDNLKKALLAHKDKLVFLKKFLIGRPKIEATSIYIKRNEEDFELDAVFSDKDIKSLKNLENENRKLLFNEPFFQTSKDFIEKKISELTEQYNLENCLEDDLFLLNNTILDLISKGKKITISNGKETFLDINNTVGGYVTIQVITNEDVHRLNCLYNLYTSDFNTLLDKTTYPFSNYLDRNILLRYVDNLAMIVKNIKISFNNESLRKALVKVCQKQVSYIVDNGILGVNMMNELLVFINKKFDLELILFKEIVSEDKNPFRGLIFDDFFRDSDSIDIIYLKRFF
jgi:hypothetical protein